jgi:hypothetical protein
VRTPVSACAQAMMMVVWRSKARGACHVGARSVNVPRKTQDGRRKTEDDGEARENQIWREPHGWHGLSKFIEQSK